MVTVVFKVVRIFKVLGTFLEHIEILKHASNIIVFITVYLFTVTLGLCYCAHFLELLQVVATLHWVVCLASEHRLPENVTHELYSSDSVIVVHKLSCSWMWNLPDQGSNSCPLLCGVNSYPLYHQEVLLLFLCKLSQSPIYSLSDLILFLETRPGKPSWRATLYHLLP